MMRTIPFLLLTGCLLLAKRPGTIRCENLICSGNLVCDEETGECPTDCELDEACVTGFVCFEFACEAECSPTNCSEGFTCDVENNACYTECQGDLDCRDGFHCSGNGTRCIED